ncbi:MAG: GspE/PulE family protein [Pseudoclavibacter sp.]
MSSTRNPRDGRWGADDASGKGLELLGRRRRLHPIDGGLQQDPSDSGSKSNEGFTRFFGALSDVRQHGPASTQPLGRPMVSGPLLADESQVEKAAGAVKPPAPPAPPEPQVVEAQPLHAPESALDPQPEHGPSAETAVELPMTRRERRLARQAELERQTQHPPIEQPIVAHASPSEDPHPPTLETVQAMPLHDEPGASPPVQSAQQAQPAQSAASSSMWGEMVRASKRPARQDKQPAALPGVSEAERLARELNLPTVDLSEYPVEAEAVGLVPENICRRDHLLPIGRRDRKLLVAMADPRNVVAIDDVTARTGLTVVPMVAGEAAISAAIDRYHRLDSEMAELKDVITSEVSERTRAVADDDVDDDEDAPIIRFVNLLISQAIMDHASDIHIEPHRSGLVVRYRIDGVLHEVQHASTAMTAGVISRLKVMASLDIAERRKPQDGRISVTHAGKSVDLRVATLPTVWGEKIVMRILDSSIGTKRLEDLAMSPRNLDVFRTSFTRPHGMVLVTGPTGSGKSTTLYTAVGAVARPEVNVITVEDPVEFRMEGINQVQVNVKAGLTFAGALRSILRSDPDVVLIGEIRDRETAQIAIEASLTGHLVLSTLHTNNAPSAITRLVEMGVEPFLVGSAMECVVAQRLARRLCPKCAEEYEPDAETLAALRLPAGIESPTFWRPVGCHSCANTGYKGRIAIHEVMHVDDRIERLAVGDASVGDIADYAVSQGMATLRQDGLVKAAQGFTSVDEVLRVTA